jgi:hypothetical protein
MLCVIHKYLILLERLVGTLVAIDPGMITTHKTDIAGLSTRSFGYDSQEDFFSILMEKRKKKVAVLEREFADTLHISLPYMYESFMVLEEKGA